MRVEHVSSVSTKIILSSIYHPDKDKEQEEFHEDVLEPIFNQIPDKQFMINCHDVNASVGIRNQNDVNPSQTSGPFGLDNRNDTGTNILNMFSSLHLRVENSFFTKDSYGTWKSPRDGSLHMLDVITTSQDFSKKVRDCFRISNGIESDHNAVCAKIHMNSIPFKHKLAREVEDWEIIQQDSAANSCFNDALFEKMQHSNNYTHCMEQILPTARAAASKTKRPKEVWFRFGGAELPSLIKHRDNILSKIRATNVKATNSINATLKEAKKE